MFATPFRLLPTSPVARFDIHTNPYRATKPWPPDFTKLSHKYQFRLERRYRRRAKLKWARPRWTKAVKIAQLGSVIFVLTYGVLFMDWGRADTPFKGVRDWYQSKVNSIWSSKTRKATQPSLRDQALDNSPTAQSS